MEVQLDRAYSLEVDATQAWAVLADIRATAACMPGASITEQIDATHFKGTVKSKVGPATMTFGGDIEVLGIDTAARELRMLGKGSDKAGSSASMELTAHIAVGPTPTSSILRGHAVIVVNGKLAQFGSRLLVPVADMMLTQFAQNFSASALAVAAIGQAASAPAGAARGAVRPAARPVKELNVLAIGWALIKGWFSGLFGKRAS